MKKAILMGLVLVLVVLSTIQCARIQQNRSRAIELNEKAIEFAQLGEEEKALEFYDKAINADETYYLPHANKVQINLFISKRIRKSIGGE